MELRDVRRVTALVLCTLLAVLGQLLVTAGPASAGELGITVSVQGSGRTEIVTGEVEDGASATCDWFGNLDERVSRSCDRVRIQEAQEAWAWIRATANPAPADNWRFVRWEGCELTRRDDATLCGLHASASGTVEASPKAVFEDIRAPRVDVTATMGQGGYAGSLGTVTYSASTDEGWAQCRLDDEAVFTWCARPVHRDYETEGWHGIEVRAVDGSGQMSDTRSTRVLVLGTKIVSGPNELVSSKDASFAVESGMGTGFVCSLDYQAFAPCGADGTVSFSGLSEGSHYFRVAATNGTWRAPTPAVHIWTVDTIAPETSLDVPTLEGRSAAFTFGAAGSPESYQCRLSRADVTGAWSACTSPTTYTDLADGTYRFEVRATDAAGNTDPTPAYRGFAVDTTAPETSITSGPTAGSFLLSSSALLQLGSTEPGGTYSCSLNGVSLGCGGGSAQLTGLGRRTHAFTATAIDPYGNTDPTPARRVWTVPLNNTDLTHSRGWAKRTSTATYLSTYSEASRRGSSLSKGVAGARKVALVATRAPGHGKVSVYAGSRWLTTVSLAASTRRTKQVIPVATFSAPYTGTLRLVVRSAGKPVRVEGLGVTTE